MDLPPLMSAFPPAAEVLGSRRKQPLIANSRHLTVRFEKIGIRILGPMFSFISLIWVMGFAVCSMDFVIR
jgi:hypothetical protein